MSDWQDRLMLGLCALLSYLWAVAFIAFLLVVMECGFDFGQAMDCHD